MRILLVEDDQLLGDGIVSGLKQYNYVVDWLTDGQAALQVLTKQHGKEHFDAVVLDLGLPNQSGMDILKAMRKQSNQTPVLILTARDSVQDKVMNLDLGADDYMVKPFDLKELAARLRLVIRRGSMGNAGTGLPKLRLGSVVVDTAAHKVFIDGTHTDFSRREFTLLSKLIEQSGRVVTREILSQTLYGWGDDVDSNAIEVHIHHIRKKIADGMQIKTIRGVGYIAEAK